MRVNLNHTIPGGGEDSEDRRLFDDIIDSQPAVMTWISADQHPDPYVVVLVLTRSANGSRNVDKGYWSDVRSDFVHRGTAIVTHWMPIPDLPDEA